MKAAAIAAIVVAGLALAGSQFGPREASGQGVGGLPHAGLMAFTSNLVDGQQLTVVDPATHAVCVYHIASADGKIKLLSARNIRQDLQLNDYNGTGPTPAEIRTQFAPR